MDAVLHTLVLLAALAAYTVLTALEHDGTLVLEVGFAYAVGAGAQRLAGPKQ